MNPASSPGIAAGDIILVSYPFSDSAGSKQRPALVLTSLDSYGDALVMPITSQSHAHGALPLSNGDLAQGQLPKPSWVKTNTLNTVHQSLFRKVIAKVKPSMLTAVRKQMCPRLGC